MKTNIVDVMLYIQNANQAEVTARAAGAINQLNGVAKVNIHPKIKKLLNVEYDSNSISGLSILGAARQTGCSASLVGM